MNKPTDDHVSRNRYEREQRARAEAESLLEAKSRELFLANKELSSHSAALEDAVAARTAELVIALERAEAASTARSRFVATMSHEIRTPLGGMLGMIDLLRMEESDPEKVELLDYAKTAGVGLSRIVNDVLDFSKMEAGLFVFEEEHVDLRALIESVRMLAETNYKLDNRAVTVKVAKGVPELFWGDATRIRQVVSNLISNAIRYSEDGPIIVRAETSGADEGMVLKVSVEDFGVGIGAADINDLFKDFSQVSNSLTAAAQGTGLGLAICKRILEGCSGQVGVESTLGEGSLFWFELPIKIVNKSLDVFVQEDVPQDQFERPQLEGKRVLIAEDNIINQKMLLTYVKRLGLVSELAENGRIAFEKFDPDKFDVVLMDVAMPEMDGLEATRKIREKWQGHVMPPILILTAHVMDAIEDDARSVGVTTVLSKPIPFIDLKDALEISLSANLGTAAVKTPATTTASQPDEAANIFSLMSARVAKDLLEMFSLEDIRSLVEKYVVDCSERLDLIIDALQTDKAALSSQEAHSIKGSSLVLGFDDISKHAHFIEKCDPMNENEQAIETAAAIRRKLLKISAIL